MISAAPFAVRAAALGRRLLELKPGSQKIQFDFGLPFHTFGDARERVPDDFGSRSVHDENAALRVLVAHEAHRLRSSRVEPARLSSACHGQP
jgi:hypothetical protein